MASKRKMVFGYRMELGDIVPSPNEAETVRYIYTRYLAGASFQCLANELNQKALPYHTGKSWNKNMVARILERISIPRSYPLNSSKPCGSGERRTAQPLPRSPRRPSSISCAAAQSPAVQRKGYARH